MFRWIRVLAVVIGAGAAVGEAIRSWGVSRPWFTVADDFILGALLLAGAAHARRPHGLALLASGFGVASAFGYGSFFSHLAVIDQPDPGNLPQKPLTTVIGMGFALSVLGLVLTIREARKPAG